MNENNPQDKNSQQNNNRSEFKKIEFEELIKTLYEKIEDNKIKEDEKKKIEKSLKKKKMRLQHIAHLYLGISRIAADFLVKYVNKRKNMEKGYINLLELISETLNLTPDFLKKADGKIDEKIREIETQHLWKNRELLNDAMSHYVREIQRLRDIRHRRRTLGLSLLAIP